MAAKTICAIYSTMSEQQILILTCQNKQFWSLTYQFTTIYHVNSKKLGILGQPYSFWNNILTFTGSIENVMLKSWLRPICWYLLSQSSWRVLLYSLQHIYDQKIMLKAVCQVPHFRSPRRHSNRPSALLPPGSARYHIFIHQGDIKIDHQHSCHLEGHN